MTKNRSELIEEIFSTMALTKRLIYARLQLDGHELSPAQMQLLMCAHHDSAVSFKDLAQRLHLTPGAITQLTEPLLRAGYINRVQDEQDRRVARVSLTKAGAKKMAERGSTYQAIFSGALASLSDSELELYLRVQRNLLSYLETHTGAPPGNQTDPKTTVRVKERLHS